MAKSSKMLNYINYRMRVTIQDKCVLVAWNGDGVGWVDTGGRSAHA